MVSWDGALASGLGEEMRRVSCTYIATLIICLLPSAAPSPLVEPSLRPSPSPVPTAERSVAPQRHDEVVARETTISILSSLYEPYLREGFDAEHGVPYLWLDRAGYREPAPEDVVLRPFRAVILENRYLQLTILPGLGGRIYECIFKPTGQNVFYHNQVLMPTHWGPLSREQN